MGQAYIALYSDAEFARLQNEAIERAYEDAEDAKRGKKRKSRPKPMGPSKDEIKKMTLEQYQAHLDRAGL